MASRTSPSDTFRSLVAGTLAHWAQEFLRGDYDPKAIESIMFDAFPEFAPVIVCYRPDGSIIEGCTSCDTEIIEKLGSIRDRLERRVRNIERRLEGPALAERRWYRLSEVLAQCIPNYDPKELTRYRTAFEHSLQQGTFRGGKKNQSQIWFASSSPLLGLKMTRLTFEMFRDARRLYEEADQSNMPPGMRGEDWWRNNASICWIPRAYVIKWLQRHHFTLPEWLGGEVAPMGRKSTRVGRKAQYDWEDVDLFVQKQLDEKGDFAESINSVKGWRAQADLETLVEAYIEKQDGEAPARSTIRHRISPMIDKWRKQNPAAN
jgi:hypothetical protein